MSIEEFRSEMAAKGFYPKTIEISAPLSKTRFDGPDDKKGRKNAWYILHQTGDKFYGAFGSWKTGESHTYQSNKGRFTKKEREDIQKTIKAHEDYTKLTQQTVGQKASAILKASIPAKSHNYLEKKKLQNCDVLQYGSRLCIPYYDVDGRLWTLQFIDGNGEKRFLSGGKKQGCFHAIGFSNKKQDTVVLCEGWATGMSIHKETGLSVLVCADTGNMPVVAKELACETGTKFIIAADNDENGAGYKAAKKCLEHLPSAKIVIPEKTGDDFSDIFVRGDGEQMKFIFALNEVKKNDTGQDIDETEGDWQLLLAKDKNGRLIKGSSQNILLFLYYHEDLAGVFIYDDFEKNIKVAKCPPWEDKNEFSVRSLQDFDYIRCVAWLERFGFLTSENKIATAIHSTAKTPKYTINPASEYFKNIQWDGIQRLDTWLIDYVADNNEDEQDYLKLIGRKFMCGLAARAMQPGIKFDHMLIFEGAQYAGKSLLAKIMSTINGTAYFADSIKDISSKDTLMQLQGKLIIEMAEITAMRKAEVDELKQFITQQVDEFRAPYMRNVISCPRQFVFVGTVNPEGGYLKDVTGNRRYWPLLCRNEIDIKKLIEIMPQLHAEAAHYIKEKESLKLTRDEYEMCVRAQIKRLDTDPFLDPVADAVSGISKISTSEIMSLLNIPKSQQSFSVQARVKKCMALLGWEPQRGYYDGMRSRGYVKKGSQAHLFNDFENEEEIKL